MKRIEYGYGFFTGGDPRKFHPDEDSCTEQELANHKAACLLWNSGKQTPEECPSEWFVDVNGVKMAHVLRAPYGIGSYEFEVEE